MNDYSQHGDPYGIEAEYTAQSAGGGSGRKLVVEGVDVRGCTLSAPRGIPTQEEADRIKGAL